ncbi:MAG: hypothetical protein EBY17_21285 [Acidobacteriia bacterium]|nr:hypothetical protein [Terriglobia bacterium]
MHGPVLAIQPGGPDCNHVSQFHALPDPERQIDIRPPVFGTTGTRPRDRRRQNLRVGLGL